MRSNERLTVTPVSRSRVSWPTTASVSTKQSIVANFGEIIPAPFACAASRTVPPDGRATSRQAALMPLSVVMIASEKACALGPRASAAARMPATALSRSSRRPITPVDATATCSGSRSSAAAAAACCALEVSSPRSPSATLAFAEFTVTARSAPRSADCDTTTGAATSALLVKRAADTVASLSETTRPTSAPSGCRPAWIPAERKPSGRAVGPSSVTCGGRSTQREAKKERAAVLGRPAPGLGSSLTSGPPSRAARASG